MKKGKSLIILVVILALLIVSGVYLKKKPVKKEDAKNNIAKEQSITLVKLNKDDVTKIDIKGEKENLVFVKKDSNFVLDGQTFQGEKAKINSSVSMLTNISAQKVIEETPKDLDKYGLKNPKVTANIETKDGQKKTLLLGDLAPTKSDYYFMVKDDPKVYLVYSSIGDVMNGRPIDFRSKSLESVDVKALSYIKILEKGKPEIELKTNQNQTQEQKQYNINSWIMTKPFKEEKDADIQKMDAVLKTIPQLSIGDFVEDNAKDLSKYGLNDPIFEIELKDVSENNIHLYFGNNKDDANVFFKTGDSNDVYVMPKASLDSLKVRPFDLLIKLAYIVNIDYVDEITVEGNGQKHVMNMQRTLKKKAEKQGEKDEYDVKYSVDGKEAKEASFKKAYQSVIGIGIDSEIDKVPQENPEVTISYKLNTDKDKDAKVSFVPYNNDFYAVFVNGKCDFVCSKDKVKNMLDMVDKLSKGELKAD